MGITGSGKSTIACAIGGKELTIVELAGKKLALKGDGVVQGFVSGTEKPSITISDLVVCDCPGFEDTKGFKQEIINSFLIDSLFQNTEKNKFKFLLVASYSDFESGRGEGIKKSLKRLNYMFPDINQVKAGIGIVITKGDKEYTGKNYIEMLNDNSPEELVEWCKFFNLNENRVFTFPKPLRKDVGHKYESMDLKKLKAFLETRPVINPTHQIALSENALLHIKNI